MYRIKRLRQIQKYIQKCDASTTEIFEHVRLEIRENLHKNSSLRKREIFSFLPRMYTYCIPISIRAQNNVRVAAIFTPTTIRNFVFTGKSTYVGGTRSITHSKDNAH